MATKQEIKRFSFKKDPRFDIALLAEVESLNPFTFKVKSTDSKKVWDEIAQNLNACDLLMKVTGRSCRERCDLLLKAFSKDESLSQKSTGIDEEELDQLKKLLTSVKKFSESPVTQSMQKLYSKSSRNEAEKERSSALQELDMEEGNNVIKDIEEEEEEIRTEEDQESRKPDKVGPTPPKRVRKGDVVGYLEQKHKGEMDAKRMELEIRKYEAETTRMQIEADKKKHELDYKLRMEELELRKATELSQNEEKLTMTKAILSLLQNK